MQRISLLEIAHQRVSQILVAGHEVIDATLGNGYDTQRLAVAVGDGGRVYGFDIQQQAIENTRNRLIEQGLQQRVELYHCSHDEMLLRLPQRLQGRIQAIMFNLGYLPGGDKSLVTKSDSTLTALTAALQMLAKTGVITVLVYPGHAGGELEAQAVHDFCHAQQQMQSAKVEIIYSEHHTAKAPLLYVLSL
ncbi:class I SAM-dependent methyltransferase [Methylomonas sp. AM2-LC]|uniref:class I SAM-dependent methyltransferase n=1 Tax=Methylomonas sp. AM2-LC TaxID=3153301 RepID=UPI0032670D30